MKKTACLAGLFLSLYCVLTSLHADSTKTLLVWGDSLSAAYGIPVEKGWVSLLREKIADRGYEVINASISGETTRGGLSRLPAALKQYQPDIVVLELGANDGLRGVKIEEMEKNLLAMTKQAQLAGATVLILGMKVPPNYGPLYSKNFSQAYRRVVESTNSGFVPFFLDNVATNFDLMQSDGVHPVARAQPVMLDNVWHVLKTML